MYCARRVSERLDQARSELGIKLEYHSVAEVDDFEFHLKRKGKYAYDASGRPDGTQNLEPWESQWMMNERALVMCDAAYALTRYGFVKDEENVIRRFEFRMGQRMLFEIISDLEERGLAIEIMILKARQLGMSTLVELLIMHRIVFGYGVNAVAASVDQEKSGLMANMLFMAYDLLPVWLRPRFTARSTEGDQKKLVFGTLNTSLSVQHGGKMKGGIAQGWTPTIYHISECALFANAQTMIDEGLHKAVHASPSVFGILESTGAGDQGWWPSKWHYSKENWPNCRLCPLFLPWFVGSDIYPKPAWLRKSPVPRNFYDRRLPPTREHVAKAEAYVASHPLLRRHLGAGWTMPLDQQWFWECGHQEALESSAEATWFQSMAGDDIEALQRSSESVFGHDILVEVEERRQRDFATYGLCGQSIEEQHEPHPDDIDYRETRVPVTFSSPRGDTFRWEFIPLKYEPDYMAALATKPDAFRQYGDGKLLVFHPPMPGTDYSIGVDTSNGIGQDATCICVTAIGQRGGPDVQVAEFRSAYVSHVEAFAFVAPIAAYYSKFMSTSDSPGQRQPLMGIEQIASVGDTCQIQLRKLGYSRFFRFQRYDGVDISKQRSTRMGWYTTPWSRPLLTDGFVHSIKNNWYRLNSPWTIDECRHYEVHYTARGKEKKEHEEGAHDDGIMAAAISTFIAHDLESMTVRTQKKFMGDLGAKSLPEIDVSPFTGHKFSTKASQNPMVDYSDIVYSGRGRT